MAEFYKEFGGAGGGGGGGGVSSLNGLTGALTLVAGSGITITPSSPGADDITISATAVPITGTPGSVAFFDGLGAISSSLKFTYNDSTASMTMGVTASGGTITAPTSGAFAFGVSQGGSSISTDQNGSLVHGFADGGGIIEAGSNAAGASAWGTAQGADCIVYAAAFGSTAFGVTALGGEISTANPGSGALAFGVSSGSNNVITATAGGALAHGYLLTVTDTVIEASGSGSIASGRGDLKSHIASGDASQVFGNSNSASGNYSSSFGIGHVNESYGCLMIGQFGTTDGENPTGWASAESLLVMGAGNDLMTPANVFRALKNGTFEWSGAGANLITPASLTSLTLPFTIVTGDSGTADAGVRTGALTLGTGALTSECMDVDSHGSGNVFLTSGATKNQWSGDLYIFSGGSEWNSGHVNIGSGDGLIDDDAWSGNTTVKTGQCTGIAEPGDIILSCGNNIDDFTLQGDLFISAARMQLPMGITAGGTTGDRTINKMTGTVNFAAAATTITVTNAFVLATSIVYAVVRTNDATATIKNVVPSNGSFVIRLTAGATAETSVGFFVINEGVGA